jgi:hypothetical protein
MLVRHRLPPHNAVAAFAELRLFKSRVYSLEAMQPLFESWRQAVVCFNLVYETSVAANFRSI